MDYKASFFRLQVDFAKRLAVVKKLEFSRALLDYSTIFRLLGANVALWGRYLEKLADTENQADFTVDFVRQHYFTPKRTSFGCFAYGLEENDTRLRIHFENIEGKGALSKERIAARHAEIKAMLADAVAKYPQLESIRGGSWLYNLEAYRRLFPPSFVAQPYVQEDEFQFLALWGQCLSGTGEANPQTSAYLSEKVAALEVDSDVQNCFPYQVLGVLGKVSDFRDFYS
jgi:hypothetical protein